MATLTLEAAATNTQPTEQTARAEDVRDEARWLVFRYTPIALFSLKTSRATSTAGKTLLTPTPYAAKMAFLDAALRHGLTADPGRLDPGWLVRRLTEASLRIGVPHHACVTGTIQSVRRETGDTDRKRNPSLPPYRATIAMREFVHYEGTLSLVFDLNTCPPELTALLLQAAPAINYLGKRGSFIQYVSATLQGDLDSAFTQPVDDSRKGAPAFGHRALLDDFGEGASFAALNSFAPTRMERGRDRKFVETMVPLEVHNAGPGFVHYCASEYPLKSL